MLSVNFNNEIVFISNGSFKQNDLVAKDIRRYTTDILNENDTEVSCIGGEAYLIALTNKYIKTVINYTNSESIYDDAHFNNQFYRKIKINKLVNYLDLDLKLKLTETLILNLANLNSNLMNIINKSDIVEKIIIINCHHLNFWKRIKLLDNFELMTRKQFITELNFITVNVLVRKIVSLGGTCAVAWNLKRLKIKKQSYPFDWCKMSIPQLNNVLENDFKDFTEVYIKKFSENHHYINSTDTSSTLPYGSFILKNRYNITFAHEVIESKSLLEFKETLKRRIIRFKQLRNPIFVVLIISDDQYKYLDELKINLNKYFEKFKLIKITKTPEITTNFDWRYPEINWEQQIK